MAIEQVCRIQYLAGGMVVFLETNNEEKLISFYQNNGFQQFDIRQASSGKDAPHELVL